MIAIYYALPLPSRPAPDTTPLPLLALPSPSRHFTQIPTSRFPYSFQPRFTASQHVPNISHCTQTSRVPNFTTKDLSHLVPLPHKPPLLVCYSSRVSCQDGSYARYQPSSHLIYKVHRTRARKEFRRCPVVKTTSSSEPSLRRPIWLSQRITRSSLDGFSRLDLYTR